MRTDCKLFFTFLFSMLFWMGGQGQSIGYSFSYTAPYSKDHSQPEFDLFAGYDKSSEYSIGISLNNDNKLVRSIQLRLSHYSSKLYFDRSAFIGGSYEESKVNLYFMEIEGYLFSVDISKGIGFSIGTKYSMLLRSSHNSFINAQGITTEQREVIFDGLSKLKMELLIRVNVGKLKLSEDFYLVPAYVFGKPFVDDFKYKTLSSSPLNHRIELTFYKSLASD